MPRLNHLARHHFLDLVWREYRVAYSSLFFTDQRALHDYYLPTCDLDGTELGSYRAYVTKLEPSLPQQAGRAFDTIRQTFDQLYELSGGDWEQLHRLVGRFMPQSVGVSSSSSKRKIRLRAVAQADIDIPRLARAFVWLAQHLAGEAWPSPSERLALPERPQSDTDPQ